MNKNEAINLIKDTFETSFSKDKFILFAKNLLNTYDESKAFHAHGYVLEVYKNHVKTYERLGTYIDPAGKKIDILIVYLQKESSIERARTAQRNFIAQYLKDRGEKDAGLIAFVSPNLDDWRFSFVKMEYKFEKTDKGLIKAKEKFTPSKRYSYLVGPHEASHTAQSRMYPVILNDEINPTLEEIEAIFSVEKVTKEFFEEYKRLFLNLADEFTKNIEFKAQVVEANKVEVADFVKKLMGQIVFLYFLQKKGWLGVKPGEKWGAGDKRFMHNLFDKQYCDYNNFYNDVLEPLFYDTLNRRDRGNNEVINDQSYSPYFKCRIPYLNGGLFTPVYDWSRTKIFIENKYFKDIFDVFDTFNFTVYESDPIEKEVAVDPEMLGKVFENLLEIRDRKSKGAFYTPREIVHYMCQESLVNYLISQSGFPEERIRNLMKVKDQEIARTVKDKEKIENIPELKEMAIKVNDLLKKVKICDPAVGSGAFPMGLLKEISTTRYFLNKHFIKETNKNGNLLTEYDIKKATLENCIYGVDIDPGAVEIARLRFWLSLVVEHEIEEIEPLPNLDYKIMQGNSLIELLSPNLLFKTTDENRNKLIDHLTQAKTEYFNLSDSLEKVRKREEINLLIRGIINYDKDKERKTIWQRILDRRNQLGLFGNQKQENQLNIGDAASEETKKDLEKMSDISNVSNAEHFEWHLNFNEVFDKGGFDIIIANPPYIKEYVNRSAFDGLRNSPYYQGKMDLWYLFACIGIDLIKDDSGVLAYIAQNNWTTSFGASKMRNKVIKDTQILSLVDFDDYKVFEAGIQTMVLILRKNNALEKYIFDLRRLNGTNYIENDLLDLLQKKENPKTEYLKPTISRIDFLNKKLTFANGQVKKVLNSILNKKNFELDSQREVAQGIVYPQDKLNRTNCEKLGKNHTVGEGIFVLNSFEKNQMDLIDSELEILKPVYTTKELYRWYGNTKNDEWTIYTGSNFKNKDKIVVYPHIKKHLDKFKEIITSDNKPYGLHRARDENFFKGEKIIALRKSLKPTFTYVDFDSYVSATFYVIKTDRINQKFLVALLNSSLIAFWLRHRGKMQGSNYQLDKEPILDLPIFKPSESSQTEIIKIVDKIIALIKSKNNSDDLNIQNRLREYEKQIDQMVYTVYDLAPDEIQIVEKQNK